MQTEPSSTIFQRLAAQIPSLSRVSARIPPRQFLRYLLVGIWNTVFGYALYAALTALLTPRVPHAYILASFLSSVINITVAFLGYKWLVFQTKGNYLKEWLRCVMVYSSSLLIGLMLLPILVETIRRVLGYERWAPYIGGALLMGATVIYSFFGHRKFTFRSEFAGPPPAE